MDSQFEFIGFGLGFRSDSVGRRERRFLHKAAKSVENPIRIRQTRHPGALELPDDDEEGGIIIGNDVEV